MSPIARSGASREHQWWLVKPSSVLPSPLCSSAATSKRKRTRHLSYVFYGNQRRARFPLHGHLTRPWRVVISRAQSEPNLEANYQNSTEIPHLLNRGRKHPSLRPRNPLIPHPLITNASGQPDARPRGALSPCSQANSPPDACSALLIPCSRNGGSLLARSASPY